VFKIIKQSELHAKNLYRVYEINYSYNTYPFFDCIHNFTDKILVKSNKSTQYDIKRVLNKYSDYNFVVHSINYVGEKTVNIKYE